MAIECFYIDQMIEWSNSGIQYTLLAEHIRILFNCTCPPNFSICQMFHVWIVSEFAIQEYIGDTVNNRLDLSRSSQDFRTISESVGLISSV